MDAMNPERKADALVALGLTLIVATVYGQTANFGFVSYDDDRYITANPNVIGGLTWRGVAYAFTTGDATNYLPLTWLSHMAMTQLFGLSAGPHHVANIMLHGANSILVYLVWRRMTGAAVSSAVLAGLFAAHPLAVEVTAWVSERKGLLGMLFWLLAMGAYLRYVERPSWRRYLPVAACFVLALLSKASVLTLPFALLLCDFWPLGRHKLGPPRGTLRRMATLVLEKAPLILCAIPSALMAQMTQQAGPAHLPTWERIPWEYRFENAIVSYAAYLAKAVWPTHLAVHYPHPMGATPDGLVIALAASLAAITILAALLARHAPYAAVGWSWYLGTLSPLIGLSQIGTHAMADRYMYVPILGLLTMAVWGGAALARRLPVTLHAFHGLAGAIVATLTIVSFFQAGHWRRSHDLYAHALAVTKDNAKMHFSLGATHANERNYRRALSEMEEAARLDPDNSRIRGITGSIAMAAGEMGSAAFHLAAAYRASPRKNEATRKKLEAIVAARGSPAAAAYAREALDGVPPGAYGGRAGPRRRG